MFAPVALRFEGYGIALDELEKVSVKSVLTQPHIKEWIDAGKAGKKIILEVEIDQSQLFWWKWNFNA
jgi:hypothetical protein